MRDYQIFSYEIQSRSLLTDVDADVVIVGALVNPKGDEEGKEKIILMNTTDQIINLISVY